MSTSSQQSSSSSFDATRSAAGQHQEDDLIVMKPYRVNEGHTLLTILRVAASQWTPEMKLNATHIASGDNAGIVINKPASIVDYNKAQAAQNERLQPPYAKLSFKVSLINSESKKLSLEHRTLRFWLTNGLLQETTNNNNNNNNNDDHKKIDTTSSSSSYAGLKQRASQLAQAYFCQLIGSKHDEFPKSYTTFIIKLMRLLKQAQFKLVSRMEVELRQLTCDDNKISSNAGDNNNKIQDSSQALLVGVGAATVGQLSHHQYSTGRKSPLTTQKLLDLIESSYPNPISVREICSSTQSDEQQVRRLLADLSTKEKIAPTGNDQSHYTRTTKATSDTKIQLVKQMPTVIKAKQPVIAIITSQYCEKLAVDAMISDKETYVRYRTTYTGSANSGSSGDVINNLHQEMSSANYVYTLGNIGDHRVVSTKLTSIGYSRGALIAAGNATTRLLGTFPEIEYVFLVGCGGGVPNYTDFTSHVRLGDVVISDVASPLHGSSLIDYSSDLKKKSQTTTDKNTVKKQTTSSSQSGSPTDYVYVHCRAKSLPAASGPASAGNESHIDKSSLPPSFSIHSNLKRLASIDNSNNNDATTDSTSSPSSSSSLSPTSSSRNIKDSRWFERQQQQQQNNNNQDNNDDNRKFSQDMKPLEYDECHFRLWRPARLDLQDLSTFLWQQGLQKQKHRIWEYYIEQGIAMLAQQDIDASRPKDDQDKLYMSLGDSGTIEVNHPEAAEDELDLRRDGHPMCHFGPIGSGLPAVDNETLRQRMISEFGLRAFDLEFDPVVESIYGNCKESYVFIRGISDYQDGRKRKEWQQYSALVAAAFMKSIIVNLKPII